MKTDPAGAVEIRECHLNFYDENSRQFRLNFPLIFINEDLVFW